jgi:hypothetical protein
MSLANKGHVAHQMQVGDGLLVRLLGVRYRLDEVRVAQVELQAAWLAEGRRARARCIACGLGHAHG